MLWITQRTRIAEALAAGPLTVRQIVEATDLQYSQVKQVLRAYHAQFERLTYAPRTGRTKATKGAAIWRLREPSIESPPSSSTDP